MRKLLCLICLLSLSVVLFVSCNKKEQSPPDHVLVDFSAVAQVTQEGCEIGCTVTRNSEGIAVITVTEPSPLKGMSFEWRGTGYGISYNGLACETQKPFLPSTSFAAAMMNVFSASESTENLVVEAQEQNTTTFSGTSELGRFAITVNNEDGFVKRMELEELSLIVTFQKQE